MRASAADFAREWRDSGYEKGETQSFYNDFFAIFGVKRRSVAVYEKRVERLDNSSGFIDLFMPKVLLVEQKSVGRDLAKAHVQAEDYFLAIPEPERPRYILACDFQTFDLKDLDTGETASFSLADLPKHIDKFGFVLGAKRHAFKDQDPVNIAAAELVGKLHDSLEASGFTGHDLERFLVRIVFCLFADDTGVFEPRNLFLDFIEQRSAEDGRDLGGKLSELFQTLNTPEDARFSNLDEDLADFPYVNGELFAGATRIPHFNREMRGALLEAARFDWSPISPAIFGSLFQSVMEPRERRGQGAHYTTEKNILKVIGPLFMDDLWTEFQAIQRRRQNKVGYLRTFHEKLGRLRFFDPACGCGNFLIIAYRELRRLEIEVLKELLAGRAEELKRTGAAGLSRIDVDKFYGIELGEFPAEIARAAMWMMDHIMNNELSLAFGLNYARIPLRSAPHIRHADALETDWTTVLAPEDCSYVLGNPPFVGHQWRNDDQQEGMHRVWGHNGQVNRLDYVSCWFKLAVEYAAANPQIRIAFVATNSICQGEQASILWPVLAQSGARIFFAHRTFEWMSEARGEAAVHCVVAGLLFGEPPQRRIFEYDDIQGDPHVLSVQNINAYLVDAPDIYIRARQRARAGLLPITKGSQPTDGARLRLPDGGYQTFSNLILSDADKAELLAADPAVDKWIKPYVGGDELISGIWRWCLWLKDAQPSEIAASAAIGERLRRVRDGRLRSPTPSVRDYAQYPTLFTQDRQPSTTYLAIPEVSSQRRYYIPLAMLTPDVIASNKLQIIPQAGLDLFSLLTSAMHMGWMRTVAGRLKSDYSYSPTVYNSFPWPVLDEKATTALAQSGQSILDARARFPNETLERLYDPNTMPVELRQAHQQNDRLVDRLYSKAKFDSEHARVKHLFTLYENMSVRA